MSRIVFVGLRTSYHVHPHQHCTYLIRISELEVNHYSALTMVCDLLQLTENQRAFCQTVYVILSWQGVALG